MTAERWSGFEDRIATWKRGIIPPHENTPEREFDRSAEEFDELAQAVKANNGSPDGRREIAEEATDVIIRMIGIIVSAGSGSVVDLIDKKLAVIEQKYPIGPIQGQLQEGVPFNVAMATQKRRWEQQQARGQARPQ